MFAAGDLSDLAGPIFMAWGVYVICRWIGNNGKEQATKGAAAALKYWLRK